MLDSVPSATQAQAAPGLFAPLRQASSWLIDLLFPPRCAGCGRVDSEWCPACQRDLQATPYPQHLIAHPPLMAIAATAPHRGVIRESVQALKYNNARRVAVPLGARMAQHLAAQHWTIDMIVPVPLHTVRLAERGYNQSQLLGEQVARDMALPHVPSALHRDRSTHSQVTVSAAERLINVKNAFSAVPDLVNNRTVLLIDDVFTTGATLSACAEALLAAGAGAVYGLTVTAARL
ncbi:MAG: ComF family protein [Anaerolineae bacterium]|nr:ComF family protein [Anaerolineae bacterium]